MKNQTETICCPKFDPSVWDNQVFSWSGKSFIKAKVSTFLYIPLNFGAVMTSEMKKLEANGAKLVDDMCLSEHVSPWRMDLFLATDLDIPSSNIAKLSGSFLFKVFEGPFGDSGKWTKEFTNYAQSKNISLQRQFMWYTTCPKCAQKYGHNYVCFIGQF